MVAVVTGSGLGLAGSSQSVLGSNGQVGASQSDPSGAQITVNASTGNLVVQYRDELLIGKGPDIDVLRTYNSQGAFDFDNNDGWQLSLYRKIGNLTGTVKTAGSTVTYYGADGVQAVYTYDTSINKYVNRDGGGAYDTLDYSSANNTWAWVDGDSFVTQTFGAAGDGEWRITRQADLVSTINYQYDANGLITQITDSNVGTTKLIYDTATRRLTSLQIVSGGVTTTRIRYTYDSSGRLASVITDLTPADGSIADGKTYVTQYTYDGASTRLASIVNSDGSQASFTYDAQGRVLTVTDGNGALTQFAYQAGQTEVTDALGQASTLSYDAEGNLTRLQGPAGSGQDIQYSYNARGDLLQLIDSRGYTVNYTYDTRGNLLRQQDSAGNVVVRTYSAGNYLTSETVYNVPDPDGSGPLQASEPQTTYYIRDTKQRLRFVVSAEGRVTDYRYNTLSQIVSTVVYTGGLYPAGSTLPTATQLANWIATQDLTQVQRTDTTYDARGQVSSVTEYAATDAAGEGLLDGRERLTRYVYDSAGRLLQKIEPRGTATTAIANDYLTAYAYDGLGRVISVTEYDEAGSAVGSGTTRQTLTTYADASRQVELTLANGLKRLSTYGLNGQLLSVVEREGGTVLSAQTYQYDALGRLRIQTDPNGNKTYFLYDSAGRQVGQIDATGALTEVVFNANGQAIRTVRYANAVSADLAALFSTDASGRVADVALAAVRPPASAADPVSRALYDASGRLRFAIDAAGYVTESRYDGAGRLIATVAYAKPLTNAAALDALGREARPEDLQLLAGAPASGQIGLQTDAAHDRVSRNVYDKDGLLRARLDAEGYLTVLDYTPAGQLLRSTRHASAVDPALRAAGTLVQLSTSAAAGANAADTQVSLAYYNGLGQLIGELDAEGYYTAYGYDPAGNRILTTRYASRLAGTAQAGLAPLVTATVPEPLPAGGYVLTQAQDQTQRASWNAFGQLATETAADGTVTRYDYDRQGQLIRQVVAQGAADSRSQLVRYDLQGRLVQELSALGAQALAALGEAATQAQIDALWQAYGTRYQYDAAGRRTQRIDANGNLTLYFYDRANRLTYTVLRVQDPATPGSWLGEVSARQFNTLGQLTAEVRYANRLSAAALASLGGGDQAQLLAAGILVADASRDARTDYSYLLTGQLHTAAVTLNATETSLTEYLYNAFGERSVEHTALGAGLTRRTEYDYDRRGLLVQTRSDVAWAGNPGATGLTQASAYDAFGRRVSTTDATGVTHTAAYDRLGRQVQTVTAAGSLGLTRHSSYDAFGRVLTQTDALGAVTHYAYALDTALGRSTLTVTSPEGIVTRQEVDRYGQTLVLVDGRGNETRSSYDADGKLTAVRHWEAATGVETTLEHNSYDALGNLILTEDANGNTVAYTYDAAQRLLSRRVDPDGLDLTTTYAYDASGRQVSVTDPKGTVTRTRYDQGGRITEVALDPTGLNLVTTYGYDLEGRVLSVTEGAGSATARLTQYHYDSLGRRIREAVDPAGLNLVTTYTYDGNDQLVARVEAAGTALARLTRYSYDEAGRLRYTTDALGGVVRNDYDAEGRLLLRTAYATPISLDGLDTVASAADIAARLDADPARDRSLRHVYDNDGRERYAIDAGGAVTERSYDAAGQLSATVQYATAWQGSFDATGAPVLSTSAQDRHTRFSYDSLGRLVSRTEADGSAQARTETWDYDAAGNLLRHTDARGNPEWFAYDAANRLVRHIDQGGYVTLTHWTADGRKLGETRYANPVALSATDLRWAEAGHAPAAQADGNPVSGDRSAGYTYDAAGRLVSEQNAAGTITRYSYDALGNLTDVTAAYGTALATTVHRSYDTLGRVITEIRGQGSPASSVSLYSYDAQGNQTSITEGADTAAMRVTTQHFDLLGRKTGAVDATGAQTTTEYNAFGDIVKVIDAAGNAGYFYSDALGRVVLQIDPEGTAVSTRYDMLGNAVETVRYANRATGTLSPLVQPQPVANASADQRQLVAYDVLGRKIEVRTWWGANEADHYLETFSYDAVGNLTAVQARNGATTTYEYDSLGRRTREVLPLTRANANGVQIAVEQRYAYDAWGNTLRKTEAYGLPEQRITLYTYDQASRLVQQTGEAFATFDPATQTETVLAPIQRKSYDALGNLVEEIDALGGRTLHYYDALQRESARIEADGSLTTWTYDAVGNRIQQTCYANTVQVAGGGSLGSATAPALVSTVPAAGAYVLLDPANDRSVIASYDGVGRQTGSRIVGMTLGAYHPEAGSGQYQVVTADIVTHTVYDALGNVIKTVDGNGNVTRGYYDKAGHQLGQLDAKGYLTVWVRDSAGNVLEERRYANVTALTATDATSLAALQAATSASADDRITLYTYDRLDRVTSETRKSVASGTVNSTNGALSEAVADAVTHYSYDGLGNVVRKIDALGAVTDWQFDAIGRQTREQKAAYVDYRGVSVRPTTDTEYDGLNKVLREIVRGSDDSVETDDRITRYTYGVGGHLLAQTDANGALTQYRLDAAGQVTARTLVGRLNADGGAVNDVSYYHYDALGRQVKQTDAATGTHQEVRYNAFGEISGKRTNSGGSQAAWQEVSEYDRAGRIWKTNSGTGVTRVYVYDANGNATLGIESTGTDLAGMTLAGALNQAGTLKTVSVFDARNQLTGTYQPTLEASHAFVVIQANTAGQGVFVANDAAISIGAQSSVGNTNATTTNPISSGSVVINSGDVSYTLRLYREDFSKWREVTGPLKVKWPDLTAYGDGNIHIQIIYEDYPSSWSHSVEVINPATNYQTAQAA